MKKATPIFVIAPSISVGIAEELHPSVEDKDRKIATISINFPRRSGETIVDRILKPYVRQEDFFVGFTKQSDGYEVAVYAVVVSEECISIQSGTLHSTSRKKEIPPPPYKYIIGNEADIGILSVSAFLKRKRKEGTFSVICGCHPDGLFGFTSSVGDWGATLTEIIEGSIKKRLFNRINESV